MEWEKCYEDDPLETESLIDEFEELTRYKFPISFRECVKKHNGGKPVYDAFNTEKSAKPFNFLFSFNKRENECTMWDVWKSGKILLEDAIHGGDEDEIRVAQEIVERYIAFADSSFGDHIAFDRQDDSIVYIDHETLKVEYVAESFDEFIEACLYNFLNVFVTISPDDAAALDKYFEPMQKATLYIGLQKQARNPLKRKQFTSKEIALLIKGKELKHYIWHHDAEPGKIQLVNRCIHDKTPHTGGRCIWGATSEHR